jgi:hypothetical protein|tara:strand:+ start:681 stop:1352 length:672 start_codon:yes stop_codon:yes gene_type:complete
MSYKKNSYLVVKNAIPIDVANFVYDYFNMKRRTYYTLKNTSYISKFDADWGEHDKQVPNAYAHYADMAMETILDVLTPKMSKLTKLNLTPTYSYARIYGKGDILHPHTDRYSCEVSTTLNLGGDMWPIWLVDKNGKHKEIKLNPSDMLIYNGCELKHWRDEFKGDICSQVFLHYNIKNDKGNSNLYDQRLHLGLPSGFKGQSFNKKNMPNNPYDLPDNVPTNK